MEDAFEDLMEIVSWVLVVYYGRAEVREVLLDRLRIPRDCVAESLVRLILFILIVVVALDVAEADAPLLCYFVQMLSNCFWIYETEAAQRNGNVLRQRLVDPWTLEYHHQLADYLIGEWLDHITIYL